MASMTREEGVQLLEKSKEQLETAKSFKQALPILQLAGSSVGYAPAFRALVMDEDPEKSIRWK